MATHLPSCGVHGALPLVCTAVTVGFVNFVHMRLCRLQLQGGVLRRQRRLHELGGPQRRLRPRLQQGLVLQRALVLVRRRQRRLHGASRDTERLACMLMHGHCRAYAVGRVQYRTAVAPSSQVSRHRDRETQPLSRGCTRRVAPLQPLPHTHSLFSHICTLRRSSSCGSCACLPATRRLSVPSKCWCQVG